MCVVCDVCDVCVCVVMCYACVICVCVCVCAPRIMHMMMQVGGLFSSQPAPHHLVVRERERVCV